jgi:hypothetical protein
MGSQHIREILVDNSVYSGVWKDNSVSITASRGVGPPTDEEPDGAQEERESLPVVGPSRSPCSPGPIPCPRAA